MTVRRAQTVARAVRVLPIAIGAALCVATATSAQSGVPIATTVLAPAPSAVVINAWVNSSRIDAPARDVRGTATANGDVVQDTSGALPQLRQKDWFKVGGLAAAALVLSPLDRRAGAWSRRSGVRTSSTLNSLSDVGDFSGSMLAAAVGPAAYVLGRVRGDSGTAVLGLRTTEAFVLSGVTVTAIKMIAGRTRPYASADNSPAHWNLFGGFKGDSTRSFASGHTTAAAAVAVTLAAEWRRQGTRGFRTVGPPMVYALGTLVGASRVRDRAHWVSDVVAGAAVGTLSALVVRRWHDAHPRSRFDRLFLRH
jgi:membrane-associated phospholipid phosphatase